MIGDSACGSSWSENTSWRGNAKVPHYSKDSYEEIKIGSPRTKRIVLTPEEPSLFNSTGKLTIFEYKGFSNDYAFVKAVMPKKKTLISIIYRLRERRMSRRHLPE